MRTSVVIVCHNYGHFLEYCIQSVLNQTQKVNEIVVLDDGSNDDSVSVLKRLASLHSVIKPIYQQNCGHLAALSKAATEASGDILLFLDADDAYLPHHIESVCSVFASESQAELVCTGYRLTDKAHGDRLRDCQTGFLGQAAIAAMERMLWVAGQTSVIAIRKTLSERIFPYPDQWFTHGVQTGETGIVLGASILGCRQYYIRDVQVEYRVHDNNFDAQKSHNRLTSYRINRLCHEIKEYYRQKAGLPLDFSRQALAEFKTWPQPTFSEWSCYRSIIWESDMYFLRKAEHIFRAYKYYRKHRMK